MVQLSEFYSGKSLLVSGATGFCGKLLVEKLLRSCKDLKCIYIIVRSKKNVKPSDRFKEYVKHDVFNRLRIENPSAFEKIVPVYGDLLEDKLGLLPADEQMLIDNVNIVFHCAASLRFNDPLKEAININVMGTLRLVELAKKMKNLQVFSYMSTAFSQSYQDHLEERHYSPNTDVHKLIRDTQQLDDEKLKSLEENLLKSTKHPNTYTLTKALAEDLLHSVRETLPIVILRPSMVWNTMEEPVPGYVESLNTGMAAMTASMVGILRSMYVGKKSLAKVTPADFVINSTIASAWKKATHPVKDEVLFFNCTDAEQNPISWARSLTLLEEKSHKYPPYEKLFWYPKAGYTSSYAWHVISLYLFQFIPALFCDAMKVLSGQKPMYVKLQRKIHSGITILYYFTSNSYKFETKKLQELHSELDDEDRKSFNFDHVNMSWDEHHDIAFREIRRLLLKEDPSTIGKARERLPYYYVANILLQIFFSGLLVWGLMNAYSFVF